MMTKSNGLSGDSMTNGNDVLEFAEKHFDNLIDKFIKKHNNEWDEFVFAAFIGFEQHKIDLEDDKSKACVVDGHDFYVDC
jgi:hypothetical protein